MSTSLDEHYRFRRDLVDRLRRDLLGPGADDELISDPPITRYMAGILYPNDGVRIDPSQDLDDRQESRHGGEDAGEWDPPVSLANVRYPSSMGMTFAVDVASGPISVEVTTARYSTVSEDTTAVDLSDETEGERVNVGKRGALKELPPWRRTAVRPEPFTIDPTVSESNGRHTLTDGLALFYRVRPADAQGRASMTTVLMNTHQGTRGTPRDEISWFQSTIQATAVEPGVSPFVHRPAAEPPASDDDLRSFRLLYRDARSMATGHGCSVTWEPDPQDPDRASRVTTEIIPDYELLLSDSNPAIPTDGIRIRFLAEGRRSEVLDALRKLCEGYRGWIDSREGQADDLAPELRAIADVHLDRCAVALDRMQAGIEVLARDSDAWEAFRLANRAMLLQRARSDWLSSGAAASGPDLGDDQRWRPFQIAFILLCLRGVADHESPDRDISDLLWFPTGGGKTEAYLGLLAFTILLRRLRDPRHGHGVTVIMRYTLRLLTIQQFERASLLICCLESIRRRDDRLGPEPIEIGLWVGQGATPNDLNAAERAIKKLRSGLTLEEGNPLQLHRCPWCATELTPRNVWRAKNPDRLVFGCRNDSCDFSGELPVRVVDEDIYRRRPSLLIATADKFASMPWREEATSLFNRDAPVLAPPELIIQDELHLISGPLGTMAGLYETAVDLLCTREGIRPKVIASTATIRRAQDQTTGLFMRTVAQFPPPGIDASDSYFALVAPREEKAARLYVGLMAPGLSQTSLLVRCYAALLQGAKDTEGPDEVRDAYWTLVGYFNSLRVLGGARMQVQDDVNDRIELLAASADTEPRDIEYRIELTSRESSADIPDHLRRMDIALPDPEALSVILATNMISVGVDINRLGLMAMMGQPQSTSEYIQATSRVGRRWPGLVLTLFNASKSRDRSHYEGFRDFHAALYQGVESSSVTPFSTRARDRGLHAVLVALARHTVPELRPNEAAGDIARFIDKLEPAKQAIINRAALIDGREAEATARELDEIVARWVHKAEQTPDLRYRNTRDPDQALLGNAALDGEDFAAVFPTLWSLRDVDLASNLYQVG